MAITLIKDIVTLNLCQIVRFHYKARVLQMSVDNKRLMDHGPLSPAMLLLIELYPLFNSPGDFHASTRSRSRTWLLLPLQA